jgi:hypothetical protein
MRWPVTSAFVSAGSHEVSSATNLKYFLKSKVQSSTMNYTSTTSTVHSARLEGGKEDCIYFKYLLYKSKTIILPLVSYLQAEENTFQWLSPIIFLAKEPFFLGADVSRFADFSVLHVNAFFLWFNERK